MKTTSLIKTVLLSTADIVDALSADSPTVIDHGEAGGVPLTRLVSAGLRSLAHAVDGGDRDQLLTTLRTLRDAGAKPIGQAELDAQVDTSARRV